MHVTLSEKDMEFVKEQVANGNFVSEAEVVRDAIRARRKSDPKNSPMYKAVMKADASIKRGEGVPLTKELLHQIMQQGIEAARNNEPYTSPDAIPDDAFDSNSRSS